MPFCPYAICVLPLLYARAAVPPEFQALADRARGLPPEFTADVLLRLAVSPQVTDAKWKRGLIEDAFLSAAGAPQPYRLRGSRISSPGALK